MIIKKLYGYIESIDKTIEDGKEDTFIVLRTHYKNPDGTKPLFDCQSITYHLQNDVPNLKVGNKLLVDFGIENDQVVETYTRPLLGGHINEIKAINMEENYLPCYVPPIITEYTVPGESAGSPEENKKN